MIVKWNMGQDNETSGVQPQGICRHTPAFNSMSYIPVDPDGTLMVSSEGCSTTAIEILGATRFNDRWANIPIIMQFVYTLNECREPCGVTLGYNMIIYPGQSEGIHRSTQWMSSELWHRLKYTRNFRSSNDGYQLPCLVIMRGWCAFWACFG